MKRRYTEPSTPIVVAKTYDFVKWLLPKVENFPRAHKFTIGDRLTEQGLDLLTALVEAAYAHQKQDLLESANRKVNSTRYLLRLAKDMNLLTGDSYAFSAVHLDEIGRMVGGWMKSQPERA
ncbi:MAG: diversity-generating retroelement protein Avd [Bryobacteraceae bacterium]